MAEFRELQAKYQPIIDRDDDSDEEELRKANLELAALATEYKQRALDEQTANTVRQATAQIFAPDSKAAQPTDDGERKAHQLLAEVFYRLGATDHARTHMAVLEKGALDRDLQALRALIQRGESRGDDVEALLRETEENGSLVNAPPIAAAPAPREEGINGIRDALAQLAEMRGVRKATYIRGTRALVKGDIRDGKDVFLRVVRVVAKAGMRFSRRLDYGNFNKGALQGPFGQILLCCYGEVLAAVECDSTANVDRVLAELQELVAASLYAAGGVQ